MELLTDPQAWIAFATLTALELVLGIDNVIFISILVDKLPAHQRELARKLGLFAAMFMRVGLLLVLAWIVGMTAPLLTLLDKSFSGRDLVLLLGGLFLLWKSVGEIHQMVVGTHEDKKGGAHAAFGAVIIQIMLIDIVFSLDSIITAVGMVEQVEVMADACAVLEKQAGLHPGTLRFEVQVETPQAIIGPDSASATARMCLVYAPK